MRSSVDTTEVQRLIYDISTCTVEWEEPPGVTVPLQARGLELFPCFALYFPFSFPSSCLGTKL